MTDKEFLTKLVQDKIDRQSELRGLKRNLEDLDSNLNSSKIRKFVGSSYWFVKRWLTLFIGLGLIVLGLTFIVSPDSIMKEGDRFYDHLLIEYKHEFVTSFGTEFVLLAEEIRQMDKDPSINDLVDLLNSRADHYLSFRIYLHMIWFGLFLIFFAFLMLYISRQARKVKLRNTKIEEAEKITQQVSKNFQEVIDLEEEELDKLKELLQRI